MNKFHRVELPGVLVIWSSGITAERQNPILYARQRVRFTMSSVSGQRSRTAIDPNNREKLNKFINHPIPRMCEFKHSVHESNDKNITTRLLNIQELYESVGKGVPTYTVSEKACLAFRSNLNLLGEQ